MCLVFSMAPDADAVVGILLGNLASFHNQITHSLGFGFALCAVFLPVNRMMLPGWSARGVFALTATCFGMHLALDWMTYGRGVMLLWPVSGVRFKAPFEVFHGLRWSDGVYSARHVDTLINELTVLLVLGLCAGLIRVFRKTKNLKY